MTEPAEHATAESPPQPGENAEIERHRTDQAVTQRQFALTSLIAVLASAAFFYYFTTHGTWNPEFEQDQNGFSGAFFVAQAHAIVHGTFAVPPAQLPMECFTYHGRCMGYFGVAPSLLRLPILPLLDSLHSALDPVYLTLALTTATAATLATIHFLLRQSATRSVCWYLAFPVAVALGPGSILMADARPAVWEEAIAWAAAFLSLSLLLVLKWWSAPSTRRLVLLTATLVMATNSRPTALPAAGILGVAVIARLWTSSEHRPSVTRMLCSGGLVAGLPIVSSLGVLALKFGTPFPSLLLNQQIGGPTAGAWWVAIRQINHGTLQGVRFVPTALDTYLRPNALVVLRQFPYVNYQITSQADISWIGLPPNAMFVEPLASITDSMPFGYLLIFAGLVLAVVSNRLWSVRQLAARIFRSPFAFAWLAMLGAWGVTLTSVAVSQRYLGDAFPFFALMMCFAAARVLTTLQSTAWPWRCIASIVLLALAAGSVVVNVGLEYQKWWHLVL